MSMFCSTIIPTVNRATLTRAVCSVLNQKLTDADFEVVVVNDSGHALAPQEWFNSPRVRILETQRRERSVARNTGAAVARGKYLNFLDDDDILLPGALSEFFALARTTNAEWLYGGYETEDNGGSLLRTLRPTVGADALALFVAGEGMPLGACLLDARLFFRAGGYDPLISGVEDRDLERRMAMSSKLAGTRALVARFRVGQAGSTTDWSRIAQDDRWGREKSLLHADAFNLLSRSAQSPFLRGRVTRAYLGSARWNLERGQLATCASRVWSGARMGGSNWLAPRFWRGLRATLQ